MSDGMFGTPTGFRTYARDQAELAQLAAQTAHQRGLTDLNRAQAGAITRKAAGEEQLNASIAARLGQGGQAPASPDGAPAGNPLNAMRSRLTELANVGLDVFAADPERAGKMVKFGLDGLKEIQQTEHAVEQTKGAQLTQAVKKMEYVEELLSGVTDAASHARALMLIRGNPMTADMKLPPQLETYDPAAIRSALAGSKTLREKVEAQRRMAVDAARIRNINDEIVQRGVRVGLEERRVVAAEDRATNLGKVSTEPPTKQLTETDRAITARALKKQGYKFDENEKGTVIDVISEEAKREITLNSSKPYGVALDQAIARAEKNGDLEKRTFRKDTFAPSEGTIRTPLPLPESRDPAAFQAGRYYTAANGQTVKYVGNGQFEPVAKAVPRVGVAK